MAAKNVVFAIYVEPGVEKAEDILHWFETTEKTITVMMYDELEALYRKLEDSTQQDMCQDPTLAREEAKSLIKAHFNSGILLESALHSLRVKGFRPNSRPAIIMGLTTFEEFDILKGICDSDGVDMVPWAITKERQGVPGEMFKVQKRGNVQKVIPKVPGMKAWVQGKDLWGALLQDYKEACQVSGVESSSRAAAPAKVETSPDARGVRRVNPVRY